MAHPSTYAKRLTVLHLLAQGHSQRSVAVAVGIHNSTLHAWVIAVGEASFALLNGVLDSRPIAPEALYSDTFEVNGGAGAFHGACLLDVASTVMLGFGVGATPEEATQAAREEAERRVVGQPELLLWPFHDGHHRPRATTVIKTLPGLRGLVGFNSAVHTLCERAPNKPTPAMVAGYLDTPMTVRQIFFAAMGVVDPVELPPPRVRGLVSKTGKLSPPPVKVPLYGAEITLSDLADLAGVPEATLHLRITQGMSASEAAFGEHPRKLRAPARGIVLTG